MELPRNESELPTERLRRHIVRHPRLIDFIDFKRFYRF
jgi:hypothetical protein